MLAMGTQRYAPEVLGVLVDWIALAMGILKFSVLNQGLCMDPPERGKPQIMQPTQLVE
jgi:hypothetical protein